MHLRNLPRAFTSPREVEGCRPEPRFLWGRECRVWGLSPEGRIAHEGLQ